MMSQPDFFETISLSQLYDTMDTPFVTFGSRPSYSILRPRRPGTIPPPTIQCSKFSPDHIKDFTYSEVTIAYLPDAIVSRTGAVIFDDKYVIAESLEGSLLGNGITPELTSEILGCPKNGSTIINCNRLGTWNHSLFLLEIAPAIFLSSLIPGLNAFKASIFFPSFTPKSDIENRTTVFAALGMPSNRIVTPTHDFCRYSGVILFKINDPHRSQRLSQLVSPVCALLKDRFTSSLDTSPKRIYISRQESSSRSVRNYDEIASGVLRKHGLCPVRLETLSVGDQIDLFSKADLVLAEHGAGLANIVFMRPGGFVVELIPEPIATRAVYRYAAAHSHLNYVFGTIEVPAGWQWDKDEVVVPSDLCDFLLSRV